MSLGDDARRRARANAEAASAAAAHEAAAADRSAAEIAADGERLRELVAEFISTCRQKGVATAELYPAQVFGGYVNAYEAAAVALEGPAAGKGWALGVERHPDGAMAMAIFVDGRLAHACTSTALVSSRKDNKRFGFYDTPGGVAYLIEEPWHPGTRPFSSKHLAALREAMVGYLAEK